MAKITKREAAEAHRESLLRRALLLPRRPEFGPLRLRPFSLWTLDLCEEIGLDFFLKLPPGVKPAGSHSFQLAALVWFHWEGNTKDQVDASLACGTWRDGVTSLMRSPELADTVEGIEGYIEFFRELIRAASVKVKAKPKKSEEEEEKPPVSLLEPGASFQMIWAITGGRVEDPENVAGLYRDTPLPVLLSFYHCALRASLLWTVPPGRERIDKKKRERAANLRRRVKEREEIGGHKIDYF